MRRGFLKDRYKRSFRRVFRSFAWAALGMVLGALTFAYLLAGDIYDYQDSVDGAHLPEVDAVVVLAGGRGRIAAAGDIWYRYWETAQSEGVAKVPILYVSGMGPQSTWGVMARLVRRGVHEVLRPENVILETQSLNTEENAAWLARFAAEKGWRSVLLMTSPYHMKRARYIFERTFALRKQPMEFQTLSVYQEPFDRDEWRAGVHGVRVTVMEYLKWLYYRRFWRG